jgi:exopolyphosphatase/guanosine-5'-triphosphate,3'-diphosphate pyrophosphatase
VLKHKNFDALSLPGCLKSVKRFCAGLAILCGVFDALAIKELRLSDGALREGVLYEMEGRFRHQDIRSRTAQSLANQYNIDREQARRVLEPPRICMSSGRSRIPSSRTRIWRRC